MKKFILQLLQYGVVLSIILFLNANNFDSTEIISIVELLGILAITEAIKRNREGK